MGVEGVLLIAERQEGDRWSAVKRGRSGYHGSFLLVLGPGWYRLAAQGELPRTSGAPLALAGVSAPFVVGDQGRVAEVVIALSPAPASEN